MNNIYILSLTNYMHDTRYYWPNIYFFIYSNFVRREVMNKKKSKYRNIIISVVMVMIGILLGVFAYTHSEYQSTKTNTVSRVKDNKDTTSITKDNEGLEVKDKNEGDILNIALFGIDRRSKEKAGRSDCIIILSIDKKYDKLKISSIMRDTYVKINGHGMTKINHAYAYGGPKLAITTLNKNFNMNITEYVTVDFEGFKNIIDTLGGVEIEIKSYEIPSMKYVGIYSEGKYNLNGTQALAYSRIRYQGNGDYERTERQRIILSKVINKIKDQGVSKYPQIVEQIISSIDTNIKKVDILKIGISIVTSKIDKIEMERLPRDGYCRGKMINRVWYLVADLKATTEQLHEFIWEDRSLDKNIKK